MNLWHILEYCHRSSIKWYFFYRLYWKSILHYFHTAAMVCSIVWLAWITSIINLLLQCCLWKSWQFEVLSVVSGAGGACNVPLGQWSYKRLCHCDKDMSRGFSDRDLLTWCWASILDQQVYWSSLNQSLLPSNCVWTFQPWTACLMAA